MGTPNKDEMEGKYDQAKGSIKEGLGRLTGDDQMEAEGSADKLKGDVGNADRARLDAAFRTNRDPLGPGGRDGTYERLFTRIVMSAPAPIGVGPA